MLPDGHNRILSIPADTVVYAINMLQSVCNKKKATIKEIQQLAGLLNFLNRAIFHGCAFTQHMYVKFSGKKIRHL